MQQATETDEKAIELSKHLDRLEGALRRLSTNTGGNTATISVQAGGIGLWICVTCCAVMFALTVAIVVVGGIAYTSTQQRLDRMQDYISSIYQIAPQLKPKESKP